MTQELPEPTPLVRTLSVYKPAPSGRSIDLHLDGNEGMVPPRSLFEGLAAQEPELLRRYPKAQALERRLAERHDIEPDRVLVTAGADDGLERALRAFLCEGREIVLPLPTFEMLPRYATLAGGTIVPVDWGRGAYPIESVLAAITERTAVVAIVSPNNPTGAVARFEDVQRIAAAVPKALLLVDCAYVEFADEDWSARALELPRALVFRTLSKAYGLAGLRIGYVLGHPNVIDWLRAVGHPYAVSSPSLHLASARLDEGDAGTTAFVERIRFERQRLAETWSAFGATTEPSQGNFVFGRVANPAWLRDGLAGFGIGVRIWPDKPELVGCVRITCPGNETQFERLLHALRVVSRPQAVYLLGQVQPAAHPATSPIPFQRLPTFDGLADPLPAWAVLERLDQVEAARSLGLCPVAIDDPQADGEWLRAGVARVFGTIQELMECLP